MTAEELIAQLQKLPPETPVLVEGYETGFDEIVELTPDEVVRYRHAQEWDGEYQAPDRFSNPETGVRQVAVIRGRRGHRR
ncbi:hypothetical protein [Marinobacter nauticus]|uniref:hypothetical protein n=1 Tax=Marinobacter nauticus TaxID=2743 RepID=UPI0009330407|nr:hypothetical protein [Marinobacter nauticus]